MKASGLYNVVREQWEEGGERGGVCWVLMTHTDTRRRDAEGMAVGLILGHLHGLGASIYDI